MILAMTYEAGYNGSKGDDRNCIKEIESKLYGRKNVTEYLSKNEIGLILRDVNRK